MKNDTVVILHNVRSAHNVGSIFRTADAAGVSNIYLTGYTSRPIDRFGRVQKEIAKTALGAEKTVPWEYVRSLRGLLNALKKEGRHIIGVEQDRRSENYRAALPPCRAFIFGNEVIGLSKSVRDSCDTLIEIPMRGKKESLNVSVATGIALYSLIQ